MNLRELTREGFKLYDDGLVIAINSHNNKDDNNDNDDDPYPYR